jgi:hypothetical protein
MSPTAFARTAGSCSRTTATCSEPSLSSSTGDSWADMSQPHRVQAPPASRSNAYSRAAHQSPQALRPCSGSSCEPTAGTPAAAATLIVRQPVSPRAVALVLPRSYQDTASAVALARISIVRPPLSGRSLSSIGRRAVRHRFGDQRSRRSPQIARSDSHKAKRPRGALRRPRPTPRRKRRRLPVLEDRAI